MKETFKQYAENFKKDLKGKMNVKDLEIKALKSDLETEKATNERSISTIKKQSQVSNGELEKLKVEIETKDDLLTLKDFVMQDTVEKKDIEIEDLNIKIGKNEDSLILLEKQNDQLREELRNLKSDLEIKDNLIRMKTVEEQAKCLSIQRFNTRNEFINEELKLREREIKEMKSKIDKDEETIAVLKTESETIQDKYKEMIKDQFEKYKALTAKYEKLKAMKSVRG